MNTNGTLLGEAAGEGNGALVSPCGLYRYWLDRKWAIEANASICLFVGLNPSTADADQDDPTIVKCMDFAKRWGIAGW